MLVPVLLAGGSGTRLWPLSRTAYPKQFIDLFQQGTLFQQTLRRLEGLPELASPCVVTAEEYRFLVAEQCRAAGVSAHLLLEPVARNTAPAIALAAVLLQKQYPEADPLMLCLSADQLIEPPQEFQKKIIHGMSCAYQGYWVVFGVKPSTPQTGYGYIQAGEPLMDQAYQVSAFVEKPDVVRAEQYLRDPRYYWNCGVFLCRVSHCLAELQRYAPAVLAVAEAALKQTQIEGDFIRPDKAICMNFPSQSIDYAVMEHTQRAVVVPLRVQWQDVGSWASVAAESPQDGQGNTAVGEVILQETKASYVHATHRLVTTVGVENLVVVETADAVLVMQKDRSQELKTLVQTLNSQGRKEISVHRRVERPWGFFESITQGPRFLVKRIGVKVGGVLSLQMHRHRSEHWVVVQGSARVTRNEEVFILQENESAYIPMGTIHRLENSGTTPLEMIEVQSGNYLAEDDIVRFEDVYGRAEGTVLTSIKDESIPS